MQRLLLYASIVWIIWLAVIAKQLTGFQGGETSGPLTSSNTEQFEMRRMAKQFFWCVSTEIKTGHIVSISLQVASSFRSLQHFVDESVHHHPAAKTR